MSAELTAPIMGINRHRLTTDGVGVTSLVAFHGCPLRCKYCFNNQCHDPNFKVKFVTPKQLFEQLAVDNLYFLATGGGVCFGGGEPLLYSEFIDEFCRVKPQQWKVTIETSLAVPRANLELVVPHIDQYLIDVKDCNPDIYQRYTGSDNTQMLENLRWLLSQEGMAEKIIVRLPLIPNFNTPDDRQRSRALLTEMGVIHFDEFNYKTPCTN